MGSEAIEMTSCSVCMSHDLQGEFRQRSGGPVSSVVDENWELDGF